MPTSYAEMTEPAVSGRHVLDASVHLVSGMQNFLPEMDEHQKQLWWYLAGNSNSGTFGGISSATVALAIIAMADVVRVSQKKEVEKNSVCHGITKMAGPWSTQETWLGEFPEISGGI